MAQNLAELKKELYESFNSAAESAVTAYMNYDARALYRQAMAETAKAIVAIELAADELEARKNGMRLPGKP